MEYSHHTAIATHERTVTGVAALMGSSRPDVRNDAAVQF